MRLLYLAFRTFPFWSFPLMLIMGELGRHFYRNKSKVQYVCWAVVVSIIALTTLWFVYRGDLHSDQWVRQLFE